MVVKSARAGTLYWAVLPRVRAITVAVALAAGACAPRVERLTMEPLIIRVGPGGETTVETPDPLLDELVELQRAGRCDEAIPRLELFLETFPESLRFGEAVVRLGMCHETRGEWERARGYHRWAVENGHFELAYEAALRAAWCLEQMGEHERAAKEYRTLSRIERAPEDARAGALLRRAICLFRARGGRKARKALDRGIVAFSGVADPSASLRTAAAEARFAAAEEKSRRFSAIRLEYPQRRLNKRLGKKLSALTDARDAYFAVVQIKDAEWAAAAMTRVGELFEEFYEALLEVPPPSTLSPPERELYQAQVAAKARPLQQQAFDSYLQVVALGERVGFESPWIKRSRERVHALEGALKQGVVTPDDEFELSPTEAPDPAFEPGADPPPAPDSDSEPEPDSDPEPDPTAAPSPAPASDPDPAPAPDPESS